ncbi:MAG: hypothetical protein ACYTFI_03140 [Planctomycetota bacterium]|jgi:hypothetical protein
MDDLLRTVGKERSDHPPEEIAAAERRIRELIADTLEAKRRRLRTVGTVLTVIGFLVGVCPILALFGLLHQLPENPLPKGSGFLLPLMAGLWSLQSASGFVLFAGGLGLRKFREWGRKLAIAVIWIAIAFFVAVPLFWDVMMLRTIGVGAGSIAIAVFVLLWMGLPVYLLWLAGRYFSSDSIREVCGRPAPADPS